MSWVKLDDQFPTHPKIVAAGGDAAWLHVCALCYCATHLTDGVLPKGMVERISDRRNPRKLAAKLVEVGSWIDRGDEYELHDYLIYNPSREHVEGERRKAAERRANGGRASRERRPTDTSPDPARPDVLAEREQDPPNPHSVGAQQSRVNGTNPRAAGTNPRAQNVDAVMTAEAGCPFGCVHGWYPHDDGYDVPCELHPEAVG